LAEAATEEEGGGEEEEEEAEHEGGDEEDGARSIDLYFSEEVAEVGVDQVDD
jgi:hypothetical protein